MLRWKKKGFILAIPESKKPVIERYIKTATLPAAFVLGVLVGIFELPCTGGIYLAILSLMSNTMTLIRESLTCCSITSSSSCR